MLERDDMHEGNGKLHRIEHSLPFPVAQVKAAKSVPGVDV